MQSECQLITVSLSQVAVSFPGATFVKGELGTYHNLTDADGNLIATNGAEMAEALRHWLVDDWLEGCETKGMYVMRFSSIGNLPAVGTRRRSRKRRHMWKEPRILAGTLNTCI